MIQDDTQSGRYHDVRENSGCAKWHNVVHLEFRELSKRPQNRRRPTHGMFLEMGNFFLDEPTEELESFLASEVLGVGVHHCHSFCIARSL